MVTFSYRTQSKNPNIALQYEWEVLILIDNWPCSVDTYRYFIISILSITKLGQYSVRPGAGLSPGVEFLSEAPDCGTPIKSDRMFSIFNLLECSLYTRL